MNKNINEKLHEDYVEFLNELEYKITGPGALSDVCRLLWLLDQRLVELERKK